VVADSHFSQYDDPEWHHGVIVTMQYSTAKARGQACLACIDRESVALPQAYFTCPDTRHLCMHPICFAALSGWYETRVNTRCVFRAWFLYCRLVIRLRAISRKAINRTTSSFVAGKLVRRWQVAAWYAESNTLQFCRSWCRIMRLILRAWATEFGIGAPPMTDSSSDGDGRSNEPANELSETSSEVADDEDLLCLI